MRGTLQLFLFANDKNRITPAHAGNTVDTYKATQPDKDHPRTCGEHTKIIAQIQRFCFAYVFKFINFSYNEYVA